VIAAEAGNPTREGGNPPASTVRRMSSSSFVVVDETVRRAVEVSPPASSYPCGAVLPEKRVRIRSYRAYRHIPPISPKFMSNTEKDPHEGRDETHAADGPRWWFVHVSELRG
jgi:hypothetical protein